MCWAVPAVVLRVESDSIAVVDIGDGIPRPVAIGISNEKVSPGDVVMVHAGVIITKLNFESLRETVEMQKQMARELAQMAGDDPEKAVREVEEMYARFFEAFEKLKSNEKAAVKEIT